jgi:hypothetical protein
MFVPISTSGEVRPTTPTPTPETGRPVKAGTVRSALAASGEGRGTPAPGAGYALTIAHRAVADLAFAHEHDRHDVELGVALVAAKRASQVGRGPTLGDVRVVLELFGLASAPVVDHRLAKPFAGLAHSYAIQRAFVDAVTSEQLGLAESGAS